MADHRIEIESGPEYIGETYISCKGTQFVGDSLEELLDFLTDHGVKFGQCCLEDDDDKSNIT